MRTVGLLAIAAAVALTSCTASHGDGSPSSSVPATTETVTSPAPSITAPQPIDTGPTSATDAPGCPLLAKQTAANQVGMRLARITVLHSGGKVVGCRFYALQNSPLHNSEHLPGPHQPAIEITTSRYRSPLAAHNAFVLLARKGSNPQQESVGVDNTGVCFQIAFYSRDHGRDWACAFSVGAMMVLVKTVVVSPALNVVLVSREVARKV